MNRGTLGIGDKRRRGKVKVSAFSVHWFLGFAVSHVVFHWFVTFGFGSSPLYVCTVEERERERGDDIKMGFEIYFSE